MGENDVRYRLVAVIVERLAAAAIAAMSVALLFLAFRRMADARTAAVCAVGYAFGTNTWFTSSQALWQHGLVELGLAGMSLAFLSRPSHANAALAGGCAVIALAARPTAAIFTVLALCFVWRERRQHLLPFLLPFLLLLPVVVYNLEVAGRITGGYRTKNITAPSQWTLAGSLLSPNRGLFVYTPIALLALPAIVGLRRPRGWSDWLALSVLGYFVLYSSFRIWWAGETYGPRYWTDVLPAFALLGVPTLQGLRQKSLARRVWFVLLLWSICVQGIGVYFYDGTWDRLPVSVDERPTRAWDFTDTQVVRGARGRFRGLELAGLLSQMVHDPQPAALTSFENEPFAAEVTVATPLPAAVPANESLELSLRITNRSSRAWPVFADFGPGEVGVVYRWFRGCELDAVLGLARLPRNVAAGETVDLYAVIRTPERPGDLKLNLGVAQVIDPVSVRLAGGAIEFPVRVE